MVRARERKFTPRSASPHRPPIPRRSGERLIRTRDRPRPPTGAGLRSDPWPTPIRIEKSESEDPQRDKWAEQLLRSLDVAPEDTPVVIWHGEKVLRNPTNAELARIVGLPVPDSVPDADAATVSARL
ncbi:hypothetical protein [Rhodococcus opacus]|uniref:Uncharacterized protein n=1 Tax=Rhodococcus opacus TaxID=37919 RepID=A0A2S8IHP0_RHOOP|nr:hypothetical protein [Rhodococcus opacus]PQP14291.1 hypothetical protein C5613_41030 [Rhodococcus opacus]